MPGIPDAARRMLETVMNIDVTELSITDDLHEPTGMIDEAQRLAARTFGAEQTFFLVGGSTAGNLAMLLSVCEPGDLIIVQRNAHKSVLNGLKLAGAKAVFMMPARDVASGLNIVPQLSHLEDALNRYPEAKAVFLTNPSYYGLSVDLRAYVDLIHRHGKMLLVDEAHGAHYGLHPAFPPSALLAGADAVVQSTHKTLPALTMGAMLHVQGEQIDRTALRESLRMIQSSSPSYPIMASLDITRAMIDFYGGTALFQQGLATAAAFRHWIIEQDQYRLVEMTEDSSIQTDPLRIVLCDSSGKLTGFELQKQLERFRCYAEMADSRYVVLLFGMAASADDAARLQQALLAIAIASDSNKSITSTRPQEKPVITEIPYQISEPVLFGRLGARRNGHNDSQRVNLEEAVGRKAAEAVIPYPPGIPLLYEGELITFEAVAAIRQLVNDGARCQGAADPTMQTIAVVSLG